jgi:hypothetical protein
MAVIEPFQQDVSRTDDRARLCLDTHRPTALFSTPFAPILRRVLVWGKFLTGIALSSGLVAP